MNNIETAMNSLVGEMERLRSLCVMQQFPNVVSFRCSDRIARFMAEIAKTIIVEYEGAITCEVIVMPKSKEYEMKFSILGRLDLDLLKPIMSMASSIDAAMCDVPDLYRKT